MFESRQRLNQRRLAGGLGFTEARGLARGHQRHVFKPAEQFPADCSRTAVRGGQIEGDQLIAVGETMLVPIGGPEFGVRAPPCRCYAAALFTPLTCALLVSCK